MTEGQRITKLETRVAVLERDLKRYTDALDLLLTSLTRDPLGSAGADLNELLADIGFPPVGGPHAG